MHGGGEHQLERTFAVNHLAHHHLLNLLWHHFQPMRPSSPRRAARTTPPRTPARLRRTTPTRFGSPTQTRPGPGPEPVGGVQADAALRGRVGHLAKRGADAARALTDLALGRIRPPTGECYAALRNGTLHWRRPSDLACRADVAAALWRDSTTLVTHVGCARDTDAS